MTLFNSGKILITGARGMLGGSISKIARSSGWDIVAPSRDELDLRKPLETMKFLASHEIRALIHCAARVGGIQANINYPADYILENIQIDSSVLAAARSLKVPNLIYFGSSCMYPSETNQPMKIDQLHSSKLESTNESYALSKLVGAKTVTSVAKQDGLNWKVLIVSNLYGPGDNFDPRSSHLVAAIIRKTYEAKEQNLRNIEIWGDGQARREFTFVDDVSKFVIGNLVQSESWPVMMNIGYGIDFSINEYYRMVADVLSFEGEFVHNLDRPEGMKRKLLDSDEALKLGWKPETDVKSGLEATVKWFREHHDD